MRKLLEILRRKSASDVPFWQTFEVCLDDEDATVATALTDLNERPDLRDVKGISATSIRWESSCLQRKCGACAMVIDGVPRLACDTRLKELKKEVVRLEPLRKFEVVADLVVDRDSLMRSLTDAKAWLDDDAQLSDRRWEVAFEASRCLQCGLCLEVCPNFCVGNDFGGMATMVPLARLLPQASETQRKQLAESYRQSVYGGCGKSLACRSVCPAHIDIDGLMSRSNAVAVWHRRA